MLVLIVEDSYLTATLMEADLVAAGHRAILASDAEAAINAVREGPDAAVVDLALRDGLTGPEIARVLSEANVKVIVSSGYPIPRVKELLNDVPVAAILAKPFGPAELLERLRKLEASG